jgi:hypothetical protein
VIANQHSAPQIPNSDILLAVTLIQMEFYFLQTTAMVGWITPRHFGNAQLMPWVLVLVLT